MNFMQQGKIVKAIEYINKGQRILERLRIAARNNFLPLPRCHVLCPWGG